MLEYLIKVTNNTLPTALAVSLLWALYIKDSGALPQTPFKGLRPLKIPFRSWGVGFVAAVVYAALKRNTGFAVREYYDLGVLLPSLAASALLLLLHAWALLTGRGPGVFFRLVASCALAAWSAYCLPNLLLYPFEFAVGRDTIFETIFLYKVMGYLSALCVALLTGWALYASARKMNEGLVFLFSGLAVLVMGAFQALTIVQILLGRNWIPRVKGLMGLVMWSASHTEYYLYALMGLAFLLSSIQFLRACRAPVMGANPAERRKQKAGARRQRRAGLGVAAGLLCALLTVTVGQSYASRGVELSPPLELPASEGRILIPLESVSDGALHRYLYRASDGTQVRYIVIKKNEIAYGVGLDACDVCGASGYYQRKDQVVCILCDVVMNISTIGFPGGCNPVPLRYAVSGGSLIVETKDLEAEKRRFR